MGKCITIQPGMLNGTLRVPDSKSEQLRAVLLGSVASGVTYLDFSGLCADTLAVVKAVAHCGVDVRSEPGGKIEIRGGRWRCAGGLSAGESGFALRTIPFLAGFQGLTGSIRKEGSLVGRPQRGLRESMDAVRMLHSTAGDTLKFGYVLPKPPYSFTLPPLESSQPLSGVLMAAPLLGREVRVGVEKVPSGGYVEMTVSMMASFGVEVQRRERNIFVVPSGATYRAHGDVAVHGDWSAAAVFIVTAAYGGCVRLINLQRDSLQPDSLILQALERAGVRYTWDAGGVLTISGNGARPRSFVFDAGDCPDLIPALVLLASKADGESRIGGAQRLRGKESDRAAALVEGFTKLGGRVRLEGDELVVEGVNSLRGGGEVSAYGDHRIAMVLGAAGMLSDRGVRIEGCEAVEKSYPDFWKDLQALVRKG